MRTKNLYKPKIIKPSIVRLRNPIESWNWMRSVEDNTINDRNSNQPKKVVSFNLAIESIVQNRQFFLFLKVLSVNLLQNVCIVFLSL